MITDASEYKFLSNWFTIYEQARDAGRLSTVNDLPTDLVMPSAWIDPADENMRFMPLNYQDFWTAMDVNSMFYFIYNHQNVMWNKWTNPYWPLQPQIATYEQSLNTNSTPYQGWNIKINCGHPTGYSDVAWSQNWMYLSCETDTPAFLANVGTDKSNAYLAKVGGEYGPHSSFGWDKWMIQQVSAAGALCGDYYPLWTAVSSTQICAGYALSSPSFTHQLCCALSAFPRKVYCTPGTWDSYSIGSIEQLQSSLFGGSNSYLFGGWCSTDGLFKQHEFYRSAADDPYTERWGGGLDYETSSQTGVQGMSWSVDWNLSVQYCDKKYTYPPKDAENGENFRFYVNSPAWCCYGDLSADLYQTWSVDFGDAVVWVWLKRPLTFECAGFEDGDTRFKASRHKVLQSNETFSFAQLYCLWSPYSPIDARDTIARLRGQANLSAWAFTDGTIPSRAAGSLYTHSVYVTKSPDYIVWKFSHPIMKPADYHYENQGTQEPEEE